MGTNCAPLVADLFLFCYERDLYHMTTSANQHNSRYHDASSHVLEASIKIQKKICFVSKHTCIYCMRSDD